MATGGILSNAVSGGTVDPNAPVTTPSETKVMPNDPMAGDNTSAIHDAYNQHLGRSGTTDEANYWNNKISSGALTPDDVKNNIANSQEALSWKSSGQPAAQSTAGVATSKGYSTAPSTASNANSTGYDAAQLGVNPDMTVAGQLTKVNDPNSPIIQQARTAALQGMNSRGLLNSSIAQTGADDAAYRVALPIAQQDANTNLSAGTLNTNSTNAASQFTNDASNKASLENASLNTQNSQFNAGQTNQANAFTADSSNKASLENASLQTQNSQANANAQNVLQGQNIASQTQLASAKLSANASANVATINTDSAKVINNLDNANKVQITQLQNDNSKLLQTDQGSQAVWTNALASINNIQNNNGMDGASKASAISNISSVLQNSLSAIGAINGLDLGGLVTFTTQTLPSSSASSQPVSQPILASQRTDNMLQNGQFPYESGGGG
jgi:hypothetical protein